MTNTTSRGLGEEELHALWQFYDKDKNNFLSKDEIGQLLDRLKKKEGIETKLSDGFIISVFNLIDKNGDGKIDWEEFKNYFNDFWINRVFWFSKVTKSLNTPIQPFLVTENNYHCTEESHSPLNQLNKTNILLSARGSGDRTSRVTNRSRGISTSMQAPQATSFIFSPRDSIIKSLVEIKDEVSLDTKTIESAGKERDDDKILKNTDNTFLNSKLTCQKDESQKNESTEKMFDKVFVRDLKYIKPELHTQEINKKLIANNLTKHLLGDKSQPFKCPNCNKQIDTSFVLNYLNRSIAGNYDTTRQNIAGNLKSTSIPYVNLGIENFANENIEKSCFMINQCKASSLMKGKIYGKIPLSFINSPYNVHTWLLK